MSLHISESDQALFWSRVLKTDGVRPAYADIDNCWHWQGEKSSEGAGVAVVAGRRVLAHRVSFQLAYGPLAPGQNVLHSCGVPSCVRPEHLTTSRGIDRKAKRFWNRVDRSGECWLWLGAHHQFGYGFFYWHESGHRKCTTAHRIAYELTFGEIPEGMLVCHKCDNPGCVRPGHLFLGSDLDNQRDMWSKGRARPGWTPGELNGIAKLTESQVRDIRERHANGGVTQGQLAREHGVTKENISQIIRRRTWKHVP